MLDKKHAQSLLYSYRYLFKTCDLIDKTINNYATNFGVMYTHADTETLAEKMIDLMQRKKHLINLKLYIDKVISLTNDTSKKILVLMSQFEFKIGKIQEIFDVSERTAFRYMKTAVDEFVSVANRVKGIDMDALQQNDSWIFNLSHTYACSRITA